MKARGLDVCFHKLTALEGAVQGIKKSRLTPERRGIFWRSITMTARGVF